jgi:hypothetical protein
MMRLAVVDFSCLFFILVGCSTGNAKYGNPTTPSPATAAPMFPWPLEPTTRCKR